VFYVLVGLISVRPLSIASVLRAAAVMCGLHALLVVGTGALFMIPDVLGYGAAVAFALWGSPAVTLLQLTASPLVFARVKPLLSPRAGRAEARVVLAQRRVEAPAIAPPSRPLGTPSTDAPAASRPVSAPAMAPTQREPVAATPARPRPAAAPAAIGHVGRPAPPVAKPPATSSRPVVASPATAGHTTAAPVPTGPAPVRPAVAVEQPAVQQTAASTPVVEPAPAGGGDQAPTKPKPGAASPKRVLDETAPMVRVPFVRIAEQLPVEMFRRGREGLNDTLRPGVSLLVPRDLLLPHLGEALAPVRWEVVADQFPLDELALTHGQIADRLPDGSLLLPLDEVIPQIPEALLALSTPPVDVHAIEEFPAPFQPHVPALSEAAPTDEATAAHEAAAQIETPAEDDAPAVERTPEQEATFEQESTLEQQAMLQHEATLEHEATLDAAPEPEPDTTHDEPARDEVAALTAPTPTASTLSTARTDMTAQRGRAEDAPRIAALLAPLLNGLEIGQRDAAGTTLVTVVPPTVSEDSVVRTAARIVPFLADARLPEPVSQATLTAAQATLVLTPFGSPGAGAILLTAVASRASLAWLERVSRTAVREAKLGAANGSHSGPANDPGSGIELRAASVPAAVRELAGFLTAFGPVAPTVLRDHAGALSACLFLPRSVDALPLARFASDLHLALGGAEIGRVASIILKLGTHRLVLRAMSGESGHVTMLIGVGCVDRPGLARIELDRAATRLGVLVGA
jgi:hypothetical protein